jgi:carboxyl-terminal processing protease
MKKLTSLNEWIRVALLLIIVSGAFFVGTRYGTMQHRMRVSEADLIIENPPAEIDMTLFWRAWNTLAEKYPFENPTLEEKIYGAISGLTTAYEDDYTVFLPPQEAKFFTENARGSFGGVGIELGVREGLITVIAPLKDTPGARAGILAGDIIIGVNDEMLEDVPNIDDVIAKIRGEVATAITLTVFRPDTREEIVFEMIRESIKIPVIETEQDEDIFIIELSSFTEDSTRAFAQALTDFSESSAQHLIIDLRNNPGGYLNAAINIASFFLPEGKPILRESFGQDVPEIVYRSKGFATFSQSVSIAVLINGGSSSASEILAGALKDHDKATIIGTTSFGKGSVQELISLPDGSSLKITVARWLTPSGTAISGVGLEPDIAVEPELIREAFLGSETYTEGTDIVLERAKEWIRTKK